jgi:hypothetical protein
MKHDYTALDSQLLAAIKSGKRFLGSITCAEVLQEAKKLETAHNGDMSRYHSEFKPAWRFIDARLQALRKAGKIEWLGAKKGWSACEGVAP